MIFNKTKIYLSLLAGSLMLTHTACNKYLDINTSPLTATAVEPKLLLVTQLLLGMQIKIVVTHGCQSD